MKKPEQSRKKPAVRKKTPLYYVHKVMHALAAFFFIFWHFLFKLALLSIIVIGFVYTYRCATQERIVDSRPDAVQQSVPARRPAAGAHTYSPSKKKSSKPITVERANAGSVGRLPIKDSPYEEWTATTNFSPDLQPFWADKDELPFSFIQNEVKLRLQEIERNAAMGRKNANFKQ